MRINEWKNEAAKIAEIIRKAPEHDRCLRISPQEFKARQRRVTAALEKAGLKVAIVYSDEHYNGDVPYLAGNTNITIEPVAGVIGVNGFHVLAGLEGGYVIEQLSQRSGAKVHKVEMLKLAGEDYPIEAERVEDVIEEAANCKPERIGLLSPREVIPVSVYKFLQGYAGSEESIVDAQDLFNRIKYEKSDDEMKLTEQASEIADVMIEGMLAVIKPGMYETQVAQWGYAIACELGVEEMGFDIMINAGESGRTLIGKALNRKIMEGDIIHIGVAPKKDGLTACERVSAVMADNPAKIDRQTRFWFDFIEQAFMAGLNAYIDVAVCRKPAGLVESAIVDYFKSRENECCKVTGKKLRLERQKPYSSVHNGGYTECQEFFGALTVNTAEPLGNQVVNMLDVAIRGVGDYWNDIVIPGLDYLVVEKTLGKYGNEVKVLNRLPLNVQHLVGGL